MIEVSDGRGGRARQEFVLPVSDAVPPRIISTPTGPARVGERYEYLVVAMDANAGDTVTLSLDAHSLARGATLTAIGCPADQAACAAAARLVWHPNSIGEFPIEIKATDSVANTATQSFYAHCRPARGGQSTTHHYFTAHGAGPKEYAMDVCSHRY